MKILPTRRLIVTKPGHFKKDCHLRKVNKDGTGPSRSKDLEKQQCEIFHFMCRMMMLHGALIQEKQPIYVKIIVSSRNVNKLKMDLW
uniref:Uncharacterized protein n=1 Tax=Lactuca sativa TaxID=4236 RepID=A0A9R1UX41_LACSA|nr:hypothetical protein LSAT_V11C700373190 [Lactuca sativa]